MRTIPVVVFISVLITCASCALGGQPGSTSSSNSIREGWDSTSPCDQVENLLDAAWGPNIGLAPGYSELGPLAEYSLYATAWSLRLAVEVGLGYDWIDGAALASRLRAAVDQKPSVNIAPGLSHLTSMLLAADSLYILEPEYVFESENLDKFHTDGMYSDEAFETPDWSAAALVVDFQIRHSLPVDPELTQRALVELSNMPGEASFSYDNLAIAQISSAGLPSSRAASTNQEIQELVTSWIAELNDLPATAVLAAKFVDLQQIYERVGGAIGELVFQDLGALLTPTGYFGLTQGEEYGDPQATLYVAQLQGLSPETVEKRFRFGALPWGWAVFQAPFPPTIESTYFPMVIGAACGVEMQVHQHAQAVADQLWAQASGESLTDSSIARYCWVIGELGIALDGVTREDIMNRFVTGAELAGRTRDMVHAAALQTESGCHVDLSTQWFVDQGEQPITSLEAGAKYMVGHIGDSGIEPGQEFRPGCGYSAGVEDGENVDIASTVYWDRWRNGVQEHPEGEGAGCFDFSGGLIGASLEFGPLGNVVEWAGMATYVNGADHTPIFW